MNYFPIFKQKFFNQKLLIKEKINKITILKPKLLESIYF